MIEQSSQSGDYVSDLLQYRKAGSGPPVLLLHGLLGGSFCWRMTEPALTTSHTVFSIDLPGHGLADAPADFDGSMQSQAALLVRFLERNRLGPVDVIATSWGGAVALHLAARVPEIKRMVLVAPVNPWSRFGRKRIRFFSSAPGGLFLQALWPLARPAQALALRRLYADPLKIPSGTVAGYAERIMRPGRAQNMLAILRSWESDVAALHSVIPQVVAQTLLVWGDRDRAVDPGSATELQRALPSAQIITLKGIGHLPFEEAPEDFNRVALDFLGSSG